MSRKKKKNIVLENILVEDYAAEGKSLARVGGKVVFIENVVPGDIVDVQLGRSKKDWAEGRPLRFHSFSEQRVVPFCSHFGVCGGCQWQMLPYEKQLEYKQRQVRDNLQRIGKVQMPEMLPILGAADTRFYRNKIEYTFGNKRFLRKEELNDLSIRSEQDVAGFHAKGMFDKIVDIDNCYLQAEPTNAIRKAVKAFARQHNYSFYDIRNHTGLMRTMQVRLCTTGELMINIVFGENDQEKIQELMKYVQSQFPAITTLLYTINTKKNDSMHDLEPTIYTGKGYVLEKLEDFVFKIGPKSFFQTNTKQGEQLYRVTRDFAALTGTETVYDLYCGTGSIGIFVSKKAKKIIGVEMIAKHPDNILSVLLHLMEEPQIPPAEKHPGGKYDSAYAYRYFKNHYWDGINFWDERISRTPASLFEERVDKYFNTLVFPGADSVNKEIDWMLGYASASKELHRFLLVKFATRYLNMKYMWEDAVFVHLFERYFAQKEYDWLTPQGKKIITDRAYSLMANIMGNPAENISLPDPYGATKTLYADTARYTIVCFWDPTCGHCKETLPVLDSMYKAKWKANGVHIFAVAKETDGTKKDWLDFIQKEHLQNWTHVYYSKADEKTRVDANIPGYSQLYDVQTFPTIYLLDKAKRIVAKKLTWQQTDEILDIKMKTP